MDKPRFGLKLVRRDHNNSTATLSFYFIGITMVIYVTTDVKIFRYITEQKSIRKGVCIAKP